MATKKTISAAAVAGVTMAGLITAAPAMAGKPQSCDITAKITVDCNYTVPAGVTVIDFVAAGGGGGSIPGYKGGSGAVVMGTMAVTPGSTLFIKVAGAGADAASPIGGSGGYNGGGAGGSGNCANRGGGGGGGGVTQFFEDETILVAAGGGSGASVGRKGSAAGLNPDGDGTTGQPVPVPGDNFGSPGAPGTSSAGGAGGVPAANSTASHNGYGTAGSAGVGGAGGSDDALHSCAGSGGGAGYFGGGGGGTSVDNWPGATGGSGSSFTAQAVTKRTIATNSVVEAGWVTITENPNPPTPPKPPKPVVKTPGKPSKLKVSGNPNASKHKVTWRKSKNATSATRYRVRVFQPRSKKKVIITKKTKALKVTLTRKQLLRAWKKSLRARGEVRGIVSFRITVTATTGSRQSKSAATSVRVRA